MLAALVERRLLVADDGTVELVHEALLEQWPRLVGWLEEDAQGRRLHRHLTRRRRSGRRPGESRASSTAARAWRRRSSGRTRPASGGAEPARARVPRREPRSRVRARRPGSAARAARGSLVAARAARWLRSPGARRAHGARNGARPGDRGDRAAPRRAGARRSRASTGRCCSRARASTSTTPSRPAATCSPRCCASPAALAVLHGGGDARSSTTRSARRAHAGGARRRRQRDALRHADARARSGPRFARPARSATAARSCAPCARSRSARTAARSPSATATASAPTLFLLDTRHASAPAAARLATEARDTPTSRSRPTAARWSPARPSPAPCRDRPRGARRAQDARTAVCFGGRRPIARRPPGRLHRPTGVPARHERRDEVATSSTRARFAASARSRSPARRRVSPAGDTAAFGQDDGSVVLVDLRTGTQRPMNRRATGRVMALAFSRDGKVLATDLRRRQRQHLGRADDEPARAFSGHAAAALGPVFSRDGATLYTGVERRQRDRLGRPRRAPARAAVPLRPGARAPGEGPHAPAQNASTAVAVSPDSSLFATSPAPGRVTLWRTRDQAVVGRAARAVRLRRLARVQPRRPPARRNGQRAEHRRLERRHEEDRRDPPLAGQRRRRRRRLLAGRPARRDRRRRHADRSGPAARLRALRTGR